MLVRDIMYKKLFKIPAGTSVSTAASKMQEKNIGSLLVEKEKKVIGIVTDRDFARKVIAVGKNPVTMKVEEIMTPSLIMIHDDAPVSEAAWCMHRYNIKRLVVTREGEIVGIISTSLLAQYLKELSGKE